MVVGLGQFLKRQADYGYESEEELTTLRTSIFGKHLHRVR